MQRGGASGRTAALGRSQGAQQGYRTSPAASSDLPKLCPLAQRPQRVTPALSLQQAKFAFYRCSLLLRWRLPHTLFCVLAWETGVCARHFLWSCLVRGWEWGAGPWAAAGKGRQGRGAGPSK